MTTEQLSVSQATPAITEQDINGKSQTDALTKTFALIQCSWLALQLIARAIQGLAITETELSTAAFVFCALIMYILWWENPFDMERRIITVGAAELSGMPLCQPNDRIDELADNWEIIGEALGSKVFAKNLNVLISVGVTAVVNAVHVAAWNWDFPSPLVKILWRVSTLTALGSSLLFLPSLFLGRVVGLKAPRLW